MANINIENTMKTLFSGMDGFVSSKSVVGDPIKVGDTIISELSCHLQQFSLYLRARPDL